MQTLLENRKRENISQFTLPAKYSTNTKTKQGKYEKGKL